MPFEELRFHFLLADKLRDTDDGKLKELSRTRMQILRDAEDRPEWKGWLVEQPLNIREQLRAKRCIPDKLVVSHRWNHPDYPDYDPDTKQPGAQYRALQRFLRDQPDIKYVWFDFHCAPQKGDDNRPQAQRSKADARAFSLILQTILWLFFTCRVLALVDRGDGGYSDRFWCCVELWTALHEELRAANGDDTSRCVVMELPDDGSKAREIDAHNDSQVQKWRDLLADPLGAYDALREDKSGAPIAATRLSLSSSSST